MNWKKTDKDNIWHPFLALNEDQIFIDKARGVYLQTKDGRRIIDGISSWWVNIHGHANKRIARAIARQARKLEQVIFQGFTHEPALKMSGQLKTLLPPDQSKLFFSDDGSTSVEVALKIAIQYWHNVGEKRTRILALEGAYHGDTFGSMSVGERGLFTLPFFDFLFDVQFIPFPQGDGKNAIEAMNRMASQEVAAFLFEPLVQGAAGMRMYDAEVLDELIAIGRGKGILCIADEVMTGFGRTGKAFASDHLINKPDIFCLSKGITGGFLPLGVTTVNDKAASAFDLSDSRKTFYHGHSFTANPIACAAAYESIRILKSAPCQEAIQRISNAHQQFVATFRFMDKVKEIRSSGTILRVELKVENPGYLNELRSTIYNYFLSKNILLRPLGNVIYVIPPYVITDKELKKIYRAITHFIDHVVT